MKKLLIILSVTLGLTTSVCANSFTPIVLEKKRTSNGWLSKRVAQALTFANEKRDIDGYPKMFVVDEYR